MWWCCQQCGPPTGKEKDGFLLFFSLTWLFLRDVKSVGSEAQMVVSLSQVCGEHGWRGDPVTVLLLCWEYLCSREEESMVIAKANLENFLDFSLPLVRAKGHQYHPLMCWLYTYPRTFASALPLPGRVLPSLFTQLFFLFVQDLSSNIISIERLFLERI